MNRLRCITFILVLMVLPVKTWCQQRPLEGATVAVYFSKKQFTYDDNYLVALSQFVKADQDLAAETEDLKLRALISMGRLFCGQLAAATGADSVYFLNENPELGSLFLKKYQPENHYLPPLGTAMGKTDYVLVVNPLALGSVKVTQVYSQSNRILTEQVIKKTGRLRLEWFDPESGLRRGVSTACWDEQQPWPATCDFDFHSGTSQTGRFLAVLFHLGVHNLNEGVESSCK